MRFSIPDLKTQINKNTHQNCVTRKTGVHILQNRGGDIVTEQFRGDIILLRLGSKVSSTATITQHHGYSYTQQKVQHT